LSETSDEEAEKKKAEQQQSQPSDQTDAQKKAVSRPRIGTPIGTAISPSPSSTAQAANVSQSDQQNQQAQASPTTPTAMKRPMIGKPIGTPIEKPLSSATPAAKAETPAQPAGGQPAPSPSPTSNRPSVGTPVSGRPTIGSPRPSVGTPGAPPSNTAIATGRPIVPPKPRVESKKEISRRNFLASLIVVGGALAIGGVGWFWPFIESSVGSVSANKQVLLNARGGHLMTRDVVTANGPTGGTLSNAEAANGGAWQAFTYPYTGDANIDSDTFKQCVIVRLPPSLTAPDIGVAYAVKDPLMSTYSISGLGDTLVAFSRVCVHLWCLWSYNPTFNSTENEYTRRMQCPCHGSNYVPGHGSYPGFPTANDQNPGQAVAGPAYLQTAPNNQLPLIQLQVDPDGTLYATGIVGQIGCGQKC
jgi:Rieske Fe-S protein